MQNAECRMQNAECYALNGAPGWAEREFQAAV